MGRKRLPFNFKVNDLVLVKWNDGVFYYGKLSKISKRDRKCTVVFDDRSKEQVKFNQIFDGEFVGLCSPHVIGLYYSIQTCVCTYVRMSQ